MKLNKSYSLNEDLNLENENFSVKKGTLLTVFEMYNINDNEIPTFVGVKFQNINGNYLFEEEAFTNLLQNNKMAVIPEAKFHIGDSVNSDTHGQGIVKTSHYDNNLLHCWIYGVKFTNSAYSVSEDTLNPTP